jgi:hypothetical protein
MLVIERFAFSQTIANGCGENVEIGEPTLASKEACGWDLFGTEIFMHDYICDFPTEELGGICYNAPEYGFNVFSS